MSRSGLWPWQCIVPEAARPVNGPEFPWPDAFRVAFGELLEHFQNLLVSLRMGRDHWPAHMLRALNSRDVQRLNLDARLSIGESHE
jgi:hypothetical protein